MADLHQLSNSAVTLPRVEIEEALRAVIGGRRVLSLVEAMLMERLDLTDGDPDLESTDLEDDHELTPNALAYSDSRPGCAIGDPGDVSWTEFHTRGGHKTNPGIRDSQLLHEDDEEADAPEDDDEDHCLAGDDGCGRFFGPRGAAWGSDEEGQAERALIPSYGIDQSVGPIGETEADQQLRWDALPGNDR